MAINLASKYSKKVDERFALKELTNHGLNTDYDFKDVDRIVVYNVNTVPLNDYKKSGTNRYGTPDELGDSTTEYQLTTDKAFTYTIDQCYKKSQMGAKQAGKSLAREIDEVCVPFKDMQRLAAWADIAKKTGQVVARNTSKTNAYATFLDMQEMLDEAKIPVENRMFYTTPAYYKNIKQDESFVKSGDMSQKMLIKNQVGEVDGVKFVKIPTSYYKKGVKGILVYTKSTLSPQKIVDYIIHNKPVGVGGDLVEGRIMMDTFILKSKELGVVVLYDEANAPTIGTLTVASVAGTATGTTKITVTEALTEGNHYVYKVADTAPTASFGEDLTDWAEWDGKSDITAATSKKITVAEVNAIGRAVKAGNATVAAK